MSFKLSKGLKICHGNCRGIFSKLTDLKLLLSQPGKECDVLGILESWLTDHLDAEISIPGYSLIRKDRYTSKRGGGILIFIKETLSFIRRGELEYVQDEYVCFELKNGHTSPLLLCFAYRSPNADLSWLIRFEKKVVESLAEVKYTIIMGDFNIDLMRDDYKCKRISNFFLTDGMYQLIRENTRVTDTSTSIIDHAYVSHPNEFRQVKVPKIGRSDHFPFV